MAVAYASSASATLAGTGGTDNLTITKPTSLASGDMMVAICGVNGRAANFTAPAGWSTLFTSNDGSNYGIRAFWKIADAGDASATDFSFSIATAGGDGLIGWIVRATGSSFTGTGNFVSTSDVNNAATTTHTFTPGVTPPSADALYLLGSYVRGDTTQSTYAITNNNPSWTERIDTSINTTRDSSLSLATALATSIAATGDYSLTIGSSMEAIGFLIAIEESTNVTVSPDVLTATFTVQAPSITGGANVTVSAAVSATFTVQAPTVSFPTSDFTNLDKSATSTFTNPDKS